jgi:hypothetical protein
MCIFTGPDVGVADTRIFARRAGEGRQLLIYEMAYAAARELAMVLPLPLGEPLRGAAAVRFISLAALPDFFRGLSDIVAAPLEEFPTLSGRDAATIEPTLKVHDVGEFEASFVPSIADFGRLDARFRLPHGVWQKLPQYRDYGFAVFKLRDTGSRVSGVHPMAFDFATRLQDQVFVPTVHVHDGEVRELCWFDHVVFVQGKSCDLDDESLRPGVPYRNGEYAGRDGDREILARVREVPVTGPNVRNEWKLARRAAPAENCYGWISKAGKAHAYFWNEAFGVAGADGRESLQPGYKVDERWLRLLPYLDLESPLFALGLSGLLPNADTFVTVQ